MKNRTTALWVTRRLLLAVLVVLGAATAAFLGMELTPGDPVRTLLGTAPTTPALTEQIRAELGFDRPLYVRYGLFLGRVLTGDLGSSYQLEESVWHLITSQLLSTVVLAVTGFLLALVGAVLLAGSTAGGRRLPRRIAAAFELLTISAPGFWVGVLLLTVFSFQLRIFPAAGGDGLSGLVLPAVTLALSMVGTFSQVLREAMERSLEEPFALSARSRGTGLAGLRFRHALRHGLVPLVTLSGWTLGALLGGAVVIETVFSRPGLGRVLATAIISRDLPVVTGVVVVSAASFALISLVVDGLYRVVDPRLRETRA
ncbi:MULTISPECIES: ABC transporter permease [Streptomyces]|uniref:ABC transporter permease n=1 Tax=Streptomyces koyangensis TaxID=188770 RepID=A0A2P1BT37_9ACTN|nr:MULTISPECIES: ABC transporter permease [Streptomyces]AVI57418.1 AbnF2 [Streptomyces koyangensis]QRF05044.1 ABC transporter permease [Streptomyces koyangensis]RZF03424.1 ABC transporter permease [Streptomyces sp. SCA2-2]